MLSMMNARVSSLSKYPLLSLSYWIQIFSMHDVITWSIEGGSNLKLFVYHFSPFSLLYSSRSYFLLSRKEMLLSDRREMVEDGI